MSSSRRLRRRIEADQRERTKPIMLFKSEGERIREIYKAEIVKLCEEHERKRQIENIKIWIPEASLSRLDIEAMISGYGSLYYDPGTKCYGVIT